MISVLIIPRGYRAKLQVMKIREPRAKLQVLKIPRGMELIKPNLILTKWLAKSRSASLKQTLKLKQTEFKRFAELFMTSVETEIGK